MRFQVLGALEVSGPDGPVALGGPKQRAVLAHLLVRANKVVPVEALIDELWADDPPESAKNTLQTYISHLRKALGQDRLEGRTSGYVLHVGPSELDAERFQELLNDARAADGQSDRVGALLREALALWQGPAFADVSIEGSLVGEIARLDELRLTALEDRLGADLASGLHGEVIGELEGLTREFPTRERLRAHQMLALYRMGRQAEALAAFQRAREMLADELGVDPSPELQRLHERILRHDPDLELKGQPLRGYRLLEQIGEGAFGLVYRAIQPQVGREVAVKSIHPELANQPDFVRRFEREAQFVARLEHPHIVPLYDYWREPDGAYLVMRFLRGGNLEDLLAEGPLDVGRAAAIIDQISGALSVAHRQGVVHRDVKPGNVLLDEEGNAYLSDFGVALETGAPDQTSGTMVRGTPAYLSPEQIRLEPTSPRSDIYALGVVLFEMLTGEHPYPESSLTALLDHHMNHPIPSARTLRPELPPGVDAVLARATAKDPGARFADALEFSRAFRGVIEGPGPSLVPFGEVRNPFKGLRAFLEADAADFFGREVLTRRLVERLAEPRSDARFLCVVGPSGSGKSSIVRAGLVPALRRGAIEGSEHWFVVEMLPGPHPLRELESALLAVAVSPPPSLLELLDADELGLTNAVDKVLPDPTAELVLVIDQLEEMFTLVENQEERARVLEIVRAATQDPMSRVRVVATLRADFFDQPLSIRGFGDLLAARTEAITPMSPEEIERAIAGPAERVGLTVERGLVAAMVADVVDRPGALPLLQYALTELAERADESALSLDSYRRIGGVSGALARRAEQLYTAMNDNGREACRQLFLRLVAVGEGTEDTRRRVRRSELPDPSGSAMEGAIESFGRHRLLSFDRDPSSREPTVEIAHEALLGVWSRLRSWVDDAREDLRIRNGVAASASEWEAAGRDESFLLRGARLEQTVSWAETTSVALAATDDGYLRASVSRQEEEAAAERARQEHERALERRSLRRLRGIVAALSAAGLVVSILTAVAVGQRGRAQGEARVATARELAAASTASRGDDVERSVLLGIQAVETTFAADGTVIPQAAEALHAAVQTDRLVMTLPGGGVVRYSPDGSRILTPGTEPGTAHAYDAQTGKEVLTLTGHGDEPLSHANYSPDGRFISTSSRADGSVVIWDAHTGERLLRLADPGVIVCCHAEFSPDGSVIVTPLFDGTMRIWSTDDGHEVQRFDFGGAPEFSPDGTRLWIGGCVGDWREPSLGPDRICVPDGDQISDVSWSADGSRVATSRFDGTVAIWDPDTGKNLMTLVPDVDGIPLDVEFSPDGKHLAMGFTDGTARIWDLTRTGARASLVLAGHDSVVQSMKFSPDGTRLATAGEDGKVKVWDVTPEGSTEGLTLEGAGGFAYGPDGRSIAVGQSDGSVTVYDTATGDRVGGFAAHDGAVLAVAFDREGDRIATSSNDGTIGIWNAASGGELRRLQAPKGDLVDVAFSPDGTLLATTSNDETTTVIWNIATGERIASFPFGRFTVDFSPDGTRLLGAGGGATIDQQQQILQWDVRSGDLVRTVRGDPWVDVARYSPDGHRIVAAGLDGRIGIWDADTGRRLLTMGSELGEVWDAEFSSDESMLATSSEDGSVRLWDATTGRELYTLAHPGDSGPGSTVTFSPDGTRVAATSADGTVRIYVLPIPQLLAVAKEHVTRGLTEQECRQYLHMEACPAV
jgi:WD40 repeat protein/serine/threonine protein kinase